MRDYYITVTWRNKGAGYERSEELRIKATSLRSAVSKALSPEYCKKRNGWRVPAGAVVHIKAIAGARGETA
jgi:hypothetical protein